MSNQPVEVRLIILTGARVGEEVVVEREACLGRLSSCDLVIDDKLASRKHAKVKLGPQGVYLEDLGSSNGTRLHDERVREARLEDGDEIEIGHTRIRVCIQLQLCGLESGDTSSKEPEGKPMGSGEPARLEEISLEGLEEPEPPEAPGTAKASLPPASPVPPPSAPPAPKVQGPSVEPQRAHDKAKRPPVRPGPQKGQRGRGGALQYNRIENKGGLLGEDLWQRSGLSRILLLALVLAVGAALFLLAYHAVS